MAGGWRWGSWHSKDEAWERDRRRREPDYRPMVVSRGMVRRTRDKASCEILREGERKSQRSFWGDANAKKTLRKKFYCKFRNENDQVDNLKF